MGRFSELRFVFHTWPTLCLCLAFLQFLPIRAEAQQCQWYAANDVNTVYGRADAACRGYIDKNGWNPPGYMYDSTRFWNVNSPISGAGCFLTYKPSEFPNNKPTNLYNAAIQTGCIDTGFCPIDPQNSTYGCGMSGGDIQSVTKSSDDPTRLFHKQQICIARKSCNLHCQMDNCKWMERVIPDFVNPYLSHTGDWPAIEAECQDFRQTMSGIPGGQWIAEQDCFARMGWYHVRTDLQASLNKYGCGTPSDWSLVGDQILSCLKQTSPDNPPAYHAFGERFIQFVRTTARVQCSVSRTLAGKPQNINTDIEGKVCDPKP